MAPMLERLSMACSTSGGTETFSSTKLVTSMPYFSTIAGLMICTSALAQVAIARGHVQHRHLGLGQGLGEDADDARAHGVGKLVDAEVLVRARHFLEEQRGLHDAEVVGAEGADAHHAKVLVAHQHGVGGAHLLPVNRRVLM